MKEKIENILSNIRLGLDQTEELNEVHRDLSHANPDEDYLLKCTEYEQAMYYLTIYATL